MLCRCANTAWSFPLHFRCAPTGVTPSLSLPFARAALLCKAVIFFLPFSVPTDYVVFRRADPVLLDFPEQRPVPRRPQRARVRHSGQKLPVRAGGDAHRSFDQ